MDRSPHVSCGFDSEIGRFSWDCLFKNLVYEDPVHSPCRPLDRPRPPFPRGSFPIDQRTKVY